MWILPDAGKDGNKHILLNPFARMQKNVREVHLFFEQKSLEARLDKVMGLPELESSGEALLRYPGAARLGGA